VSGEGEGKVRVATVNVGTMVGRSREVVEMLTRRRVDICCVQEVQYKGEGCKVFGDDTERYKFWWSGEKKEKRGGVGILLRGDLEKDVVEVQRMSSRIMSIKMILGGKVCHVVSSYAPQGGRPEEEKVEFWGILDDSIGRIPEEDLLILGGDLNGHVGKDRKGFEEIMGVNGFGVRNEDGEKILEFCQGRKLRIVNTMFKKDDRQKVTYKSGGAETQIDYMLVRENGNMKVTNCKVIPGEACLTQHRLMCSDIQVKGTKRYERKRGMRKIKQWKLREESVRREFEENVEKRLDGKG
jgi:hypothetical protein